MQKNRMGTALLPYLMLALALLLLLAAVWSRGVRDEKAAYHSAVLAWNGGIDA